jgi:hypothetical protein
MSIQLPPEIWNQVLGYLIYSQANYAYDLLLPSCPLHSVCSLWREILYASVTDLARWPCSRLSLALNDERVVCFQSLVFLDSAQWWRFELTDSGFSALTSLTLLSLLSPWSAEHKRDAILTDAALSRLTNLTTLELSGLCHLTAIGFRTLTRLSTDSER